MSEHLGKFLIENPRAGLIEVMDKTGLTSEPVLDYIGYYELHSDLKEEVYSGDLDLYQIWCLSLLDSDIQCQFWRNHRDIPPAEFKTRAAETRRYYRALKFVEDYGVGPEALIRIAEISEEEASRVFARFMEVYPNLRNMLNGRPDADL